MPSLALLSVAHDFASTLGKDLLHEFPSMLSELPSVVVQHPGAILDPQKLHNFSLRHIGGETYTKGARPVHENALQNLRHNRV